MPQPLSTTQIQQYIDAVKAGGVGAARQMYDSLYAQGYNYAGWASGVAKGNTITGQSALDYLSGTAMVGLGGDACRNLTSEQIDQIRVDMAKGYLQALYNIADRSGGTVARDVKYDETERFHDDAFQKNGLGLDNWTLKVPMELLRREKGEQAVEDVWQRVRDTGGDGFDSLMVSTGLLNVVGRNAFSPDPATRQQAQDWLDKVPGPANWQQIKKFIEIFFKASDSDSMDWETNYDQLGNVIATTFTASQSYIPPRRDPLVLDLDGDGLETVGPAQSGVKFDHDADGVKTGTGWVKPDDGFLVMDRNGNGAIDNGRELFGDATLLYTGGTAADGFAALAQDDSNGDGKITSADSKWSSLRIWRDLNQDGISQSSELRSMADAGIAGINVAKTANSVTLSNGNQIADLGTYTKADGTSGTLGETSQMADINLAQDTFRTEFTDAIPIDADVVSLPEMKGSGLVRDLRQAASMDTPAGNALKAKLAEFSAATGPQQKALLDDLLLAWADTSTLIARMQDRNPSQVNVVWGNTSVQAQWESKLHILESFNGRYFFALPGDTFTGALNGLVLSAPDSQGKRTATVNFFGEQLAQLQQGIDSLKESVYASMVLQTRLKPVIDKIQLVVDEGGVHFDFSQLDAELAARVESNALNGLADMFDMARYAQSMLGGTGYDAWEKLENTLRNRTIGIDTLNALGIKLLGAANDTVSGTSADELFLGGSGDDSVSGASGSDVIIGGSGNDSLSGGTGSDIYVFHAGGGYDTVNENANEGIDVLQLGAGLDADATQINRESNDLVLAFNANDKVRIYNYFSQNRIEQIRFADGTAWDYAAVAGKLVYNGTAEGNYLYGLSGYANRINGMGGNDYIYGADKDDVLSGGTGNDNLSGGAGNDMLSGGTGNDSLNGGSGSDIYVYSLGDGADAIDDYDSYANSDKLQFGAGIEADAVAISRSGDDLILGIGADDRVTLKRYFGSDSYRIEQIQFADGTAWDLATVAGKLVYNGTAEGNYLYGLSGYANRINGLDGNDTISGADKDDVLTGGAGNDTINGGAGNDTYAFNLGDGADTITDYSGTGDKLQFGVGIGAAAIQLNRSGNDVILCINTSDKVTLTDYFYISSDRIETIAFADGTVWDYATVANKLVYNGTASGEYLYGLSGYANRINGLGGNDYIYGADKDDLLSGGTGNDTINGRAGNDTYAFNLGDGADIITDSSGTGDKLQFGVGIGADAIQLSRSGNDLTFNVNTTDKVAVRNYFSEGRIETVAFADGTSWDIAATLSKLTYNGTAGADTMVGDGAYANRINGLGGNDSISGGSAADMLGGGAGNDTINGGAGNDTYAFNLGDGADTITDYSSAGYGRTGYSGTGDKLQFGVGIGADAIQLSRSGNDLTFNVNATDKVTMKDYFHFYTSEYRIETIAFADGTTWDVGTTIGKLIYTGTEGVDYLTGDYSYGNRINGLGGNDIITGGSAADMLDGGAGNDTIRGSRGNDTYVFNLGGGADTISDIDVGASNDRLQFGAGISDDAVQLSRSGYDLTFNVNATDKVTVTNYFHPSEGSISRIETIAFADGTSWDVAATIGKLTYNGTAGADTMTGDYTYGNRINGLDGNDSIIGGCGADVLDGGAGNDTITGGAGNDIFRFTSPDEGSDTLSDFTSGSDVIHVIGSNFGLVPGVGVALLAGATTPSASSAAPQFLYNTTTGALYFDQDGVESAYGAVQIATLTGQKNLVASDIVVAEM